MGTEEKINKYRAKPFWAWSGSLKKEDLLSQIDYFKEMGFGGFFIHSRVGLVTEYLGDEWFDLIKECILYAEKKDMEVWLYDEDRWPSGTAGGLVTADEDTRMRYISLYYGGEDYKTAEFKKVLNRFGVVLDEDERIISYRVLTKDEDIKKGETEMIFCEELMKPSSVYNGNTYIDTMNRKSVDSFISLTHEKYKEKLGAELFSKVKGIFTDEEYRGAIFNGFSISNDNKARMTPYTGMLFDTYREKWGTELSEKLPELYFRKKDSDFSETTKNYVDTLNELLVENFAKPYQEYCNQNDIILTGHVLHENSLSIQTSLIGSVMRYYEYMDYPGIDILGRYNRCYWVPKQCASVASQMGKEMVLSEIYGCTGWQMTFEDYKNLTDWQLFFGVNFRCPHLSWSTMSGESKRDYPASFSKHSAWYKEYRYLEDYFARISYYLSEHEKVVDVLVVNPIESMWGYVKKDWLIDFDPNDKNVKNLDAAYEKQFMRLIDKHIDFDYGDETIMERYAEVEVDGGKTYLRINKMRYSEVLVENLVSPRASTIKIIDEFKEKGGRVVYSVDELADNKYVTASQGIALTLRKDADGLYIFMLNLDINQKLINGKIKLADEYRDYFIEEIDLRTDKIKSVTKGSELTLDFEKGEEKMLRVIKNAAALPPDDTVYTPIALPEKMKYVLSEYNVLVLDSASYTVDGNIQNDGEPLDVLKIDRELRGRYSLTLRGGEMYQPWYSQKISKNNFDKALCDLVLDFDFIVEERDFNSLYIVTEETEQIRVYVNSERIMLSDKQKWIDDCFCVNKIDKKFVNKGRNRITIVRKFASSSNIEAIYLLGDFGVRLPSTLIRLPETLKIGDISEQGLPFYSGKVKYFTGIKEGNVSIKFDSLAATVINIGDGKQEKKIAFAPYTEKISLQGELNIECVLTRRNTFGPHHLPTTHLEDCNPTLFVTENDAYTTDYVLIPQGLTKVVK